MDGSLKMEADRLGRLRTCVLGLAFIFPLLVVGNFYLAWLIGWALIGYPPRPSLDDPKDVLGAYYIVSGIPLLLMPVGWCLAFSPIPLCVLNRSGWLRCVRDVFFLVTLWVAAIVFLRMDVFHVVTWWFD